MKRSSASERFAARLEYVTIDDRHLAFRRLTVEQDVSESKIPIVLLHGLLDQSASFAALVDELVAAGVSDMPILAPDARGHGDSSWTPGDYWFPNYLADLEALLDALQIERAVLVGHSMGGQVASLYAGARPDRVAALVLLDTINVPDSDVDDTPKRYRDWLDVRRNAPPAKIYNDIKTFVTRLEKRYPELNSNQHEYLAALWSTPADDGKVRLRADPAHQRRNAYGFHAGEAKALWQAVTAPVLMLDGGDSPAKWFTPPDEMADRRACFNKLSHVDLDGLGHLLHIQAPERVAAHIADFLTETQPK